MFLSKFLPKKKEEARKDVIIKDNIIAIETFRSLRTNIQFSLVDNPKCKKILITSSVSREGKSTVSVNLAVSLASSNFKTLIIDCDLRKPRLHKFLDKSCVPGLSNFLVGNAQFSEIFCSYEENPNLDFVFSGVVPPNSIELLASNEMQVFLSKAEEIYDYIIFDSPPVLSVSDSIILSAKVNGVVIVCKEGHTRKAELHKTISNLKFGEAKILGLVLNNSKFSKKKDYQFNYYTTR